MEEGNNANNTNNANMSSNSTPLNPAEAAAQVLGKDMQTVLEQTCRNGERLFGIPAAEKGAEPCV